MPQGTKALSFVSLVLGNTLNIHQEFVQRLRQRLQLSEVRDVNRCDVVVAFVPIVSRAGTDVEAALRKIPNTTQPVVLVALHFTFDENYAAPTTDGNVGRSNVLAVDLLCYEDLGLLRCLRNDKGLKAVTDHLISMGASPNDQLEIDRSQRPCSPSLLVCICIVFFIAVAIAIGFSVYLRKWKNYNQAPNATTTTLLANGAEP